MNKSAFLFAEKYHENQVRKYTNDPYIFHPVNVSKIVEKFGGTKDMIDAALLHDTVEDTNATIQDIRNNFNDNISNLVEWLTDISKPEDGDRQIRKQIDCDHIASSPIEAMAIKCADLIDNTDSIVKYDKVFAKIYLKEKKSLLQVMSKLKDTKYKDLYELAIKTYKNALIELNGESIPGKVLVEMQFGSHVYGTSTPESDTDIKCVYIPNLKYLMTKGKSKSILVSTGVNNEKNDALDIDIECFDLKSYIDLLSEGQTVALDMLFTPKEFWTKSSPEWEFLVANRDKLICSDATAFIGYCYTQASKYGLKGSRIDALEIIINKLNTCNHNLKIGELGIKFDDLNNEYIKVIESKGLGESHYLQVLDKKFGFNLKTKDALVTLNHLYDRYGSRARLAKDNKGIDWKAMLHALRITLEAKELLTTGHITFPRPEADLLLKIRNNKNEVTISYDKVSSIVAEHMEELKELEKKSTLPKKIDKDFWLDKIEEFYRDYYGNK